MINIALLGAGRIGKMHAGLIAAAENASLLYVYDTYGPSAQGVASRYNCEIAESLETILNDSRVDAVLIATATDTHVNLITQSALAGKAILCEKPIDLSTELVEQCWKQIKHCNVPIQIGFNRRFDPTHSTLKQTINNGQIGELQQVIITSRDPDIAPSEYLRSSGGIFRDMVIHDFDMLRFITDEEFSEVHAIGSTLISPDLAEFNDVDSTMLLLKTTSGKLCHINASRRSVYGYDQRIEAFGSGGKVNSNNPKPHSVSVSTSTQTDCESPLNPFFIERYADSYKTQLAYFLAAVEGKQAPSPSFYDGLMAQKLADAAQTSLETGQAVTLK